MSGRESAPPEVEAARLTAIRTVASRALMLIERLYPMDRSTALQILGEIEEVGIAAIRPTLPDVPAEPDWGSPVWDSTVTEAAQTLKQRLAEMAHTLADSTGDGWDDAITCRERGLKQALDVLSFAEFQAGMDALGGGSR